MIHLKKIKFEHKHLCLHHFQHKLLVLIASILLHIHYLSKQLLPLTDKKGFSGVVLSGYFDTPFITDFTVCPDSM